MATQPTNLPVPSESPRDLKFNAGKIDEFVTSLVNTYTDRFGNEHYTIEGLRWLAQQAIAQYGWIPFGTFQDGATLTLPNQILKDEVSGEYYRWDGSLPKDVPAGSTPDTAGGVGVGAWLSVGDSTLKAMLASSLGAGMVGYDSGETYAPGTVGEALGPYTATGGDNKYSKEDRARWRMQAEEFGDPSTDIAASITDALTSVDAETSPVTTVNTRGGTVYIRRGIHPAISTININRGVSGVTSMTIRGDGQSSTEINGSGLPVGADGIAGTTTGPAYGEISDLKYKQAPHNGFRLSPYSRMTLRNIQAESCGADGFYGGIGFIVNMDKAIFVNSAVNGAYFDPALQHTSHVINTGYAAGNAGSGWVWGFMNYSVANAVASDSNAQYGHLIMKGNCFALNGCGAESNNRSGFAAISNSTVGQTTNVTINNAFSYANNAANLGYANLLHVTASNGVPCEIRINDSSSLPSGAGSSTKDIIVDGIGAVVKSKGNSTPNGVETKNGGYIIHDPETLLVRSITVPVSTATVVCNMRSTQGHRTRYGGMVTVMASNSAPSTGERNTSLYILNVHKSIGGGAQVSVISQSGHVSGGGGSLPSFTWTLVGDQLVATPMTGVGGTQFWFEVDTMGPIVAYSL